MSMRGCYRRVTPTELDAVRAEPLALAALLDPPGGVRPAVSRNFDLGADWQAVHFLLTGDAWSGGRPLADAVLGGEPLGEEYTTSYGPVRYLDVERVGTVAAALAEVPVPELLSRFDPMAMNAAEVYPGGWAERPESRERLADHYEGLRQVFAAAAAAGDALILYLA